MNFIHDYTCIFHCYVVMLTSFLLDHGE